MRGLAIVTAATVLAGCLDPNDKFMDPTEMPPMTTMMTTTTMEPPTSDGPGTTSDETTATPTTASVPTMSMDTETGPVCGNGVPETGEACDDGDDDDTDACTNACTAATCGDGIVWAGEEPCDDGDGDDDDDCLSTCVFAKCGDGVKHATKEECDDGNQNNSDDCIETCKFPACGDGYMQPPEECDDGDNADFDGCDMDCTMTQLNVFVTSQTFNGDLDGLAGAAMKCNDAATAAMLPGPIKYRAWLSDNMHPAATEVLHNDNFGVYVRPDGALVAESWAQLTSGNLLAPINVTEWGDDPPPSSPAQCGLTTLVYTNSTLNGSVKVMDYDCKEWSMTTGPAAFGNYDAMDETWTEACAQMPMPTCGTLAPIYCIQEPL